MGSGERRHHRSSASKELPNPAGQAGERPRGDHRREMGGTILSQVRRTTVLRRIVSLAVAGAALLAAFGCGGGGNDASVSAGTPRNQAIVPAAEGDVSASGLRTVTYQGVSFDVPADWPVYDLAADPSTCVRFDVHAVYLGHPGADMVCPSGIVGRADAVLGRTDRREHEHGRGRRRCFGDDGRRARGAAGGRRCCIERDRGAGSERGREHHPHVPGLRRHRAADPPVVPECVVRLGLRTITSRVSLLAVAIVAAALLSACLRRRPRRLRRRLRPRRRRPSPLRASPRASTRARLPASPR